jgi:thioredoxin
MVCALPDAGADGRGDRRTVRGQRRSGKAELDDNPSTAEAYEIKGIPTLILFGAGREVDRVVGVASKGSISRMIENYCSLAPNLRS